MAGFGTPGLCTGDGWESERKPRLDHGELVPGNLIDGKTMGQYIPLGPPRAYAAPYKKYQKQAKQNFAKIQRGLKRNKKMEP